MDTRSVELDDLDRLSRLLALPVPVTGLLAAWCGSRITARVEDRYELAVEDEYETVAASLTRYCVPTARGDEIQHRCTTLCAQVRTGASTRPLPIIRARALVNLSRLPLAERTALRQTELPLGAALAPLGVTRVTRRIARRAGSMSPDSCVLEVDARLDLPAAGGGHGLVACVEEHYLAAVIDTGVGGRSVPADEPVHVG